MQEVNFVRKLLKLLLAIIFLIVFSSIVAVVFLKLLPEKDKSSFVGESYDIDEEIDEENDLESYYEDNSEKIVETVKVGESEGIFSEREIYNEMESRGFPDTGITTEYDDEGNYVPSQEAAKRSKKKHPVYQFQYVSQNDEIWMVFVIDSQIMAYPVSYNMLYSDKVKVIVSEEDIITSYDSGTNMFYKTIPKESALRVVIVDKIDASTLDTITPGDLEK